MRTWLRLTAQQLLHLMQELLGFGERRARTGRVTWSGPRIFWAGVLLGACQLPITASAQPIELTSFDLVRNPDLLLNFSVRLDLPTRVEEALHKGIPLHFSAQAVVYRERWYWRDAVVQEATRQWRLAFQPLTRQYRLSLDGQHRVYESLPDALGVISSAAAWRLASQQQMASGADYVLFSYRLNLDALPGPLQLGIGNSAAWQLQLERRQAL